MAIPFIDLSAQQNHVRKNIDVAISRVLDEGKYIMGPQVMELEQKLSEFAGAKHCLSCANGTDALQLALLSLGIGHGDAVFVPSFTFAATAEVVPFVGATPVFIDVDPDTFNVDTGSLKRAIKHAASEGLKPACVIPVDLFGLPADYDAISAIAHESGMKVIGDAAQSFGSQYKNYSLGERADISTTSFFPAKPLGCYGDGGAVFTDNADLANLVGSYRVHGKGTHKYDNERIGMNSRLDTLQAAILLEKLKIYADELTMRESVAVRYTAALSPHFAVQDIPAELASSWAQYTIRTRSSEHRAEVMTRAKEAGVPTVIYYPKPLHTQIAFSQFPTDPNGLKTSEALSQSVVSLPMHPYLDSGVQDMIIETVLG